jgi:hypothetical protein
MLDLGTAVHDALDHAYGLDGKDRIAAGLRSLAIDTMRQGYANGATTLDKLKLIATAFCLDDYIKTCAEVAMELVANPASRIDTSTSNPQGIDYDPTTAASTSPLSAGLPDGLADRRTAMPLSPSSPSNKHRRQNDLPMDARMIRLLRNFKSDKLH